MTRTKVRSAVGAEGGGGLLDLAVDLGDDRLDGAHHEGQADEDEGDPDAERGVGDLDPERREELPEGAVRGVEGGERDAGDRRRQREGEIHGRVDQAAAGEVVAHQDPGERQPEGEVEERREEARCGRRGRAPPRPGGWRGSPPSPARPMPAPLRIRAPIGTMTMSDRIASVVPKARPKPGRGDGWRKRAARIAVIGVTAACRSGRRRRRRRSAPAAPWPSRRSRRSMTRSSSGEAFDVGGFGGAHVPGAVEVPERDGLALGAVEVAEVFLGGLALLVGGDVAVDERDRRLGEDRDRGLDDVELVLAELLEREVGLVLPGEEHVADAALGEGRRRAAGAGVEDRHVGEEVVHVVADGVLVAVERAVGPGPGGEVVPARAAGGLRVGGDDLDVVARRGRPSPRSPSGSPRAPGRRWSRCRARSCAAGAICQSAGILPDLAAMASTSLASARVTTCAARPSMTARAWAPEPPCEASMVSAAWPSACQCALKASL